MHNMTPLVDCNSVSSSVPRGRWLKFLIIWRFFRLAALAAGVDAPENMRRCFANNYDIEVHSGWSCIS